MSIEVVFLDIGGPIYDDAYYYSAVLRAIREMGGAVTDEEYAREYEECRGAQSGSFRERLARRFLGPGADVDEVQRRASRYWSYPAEALFPDVKPCLEELSTTYRLGVIANQPSRTRDAMRRDGIDGYFEVWGVSEDLGIEKPDPRLFAHALRTASVHPGNAVMCGDRLDYDIRPAKEAGMRTVWILRGEAPPEPTEEQLAEPDAWCPSLRPLPGLLEELSSQTRG